MLSLISVLVLLIISLYNVHGDTDNCNYVVDYFWISIRAPTTSPTNAPSPSPTDAPTPSPTMSPTKSPLAGGETLEPTPSPLSAGQTHTPTLVGIDIDGGGDNNHNPDETILKPMTFDYCYSFPDTKFYTGDFSLKYQCNTDDNLVRKIYYNTLNCDSVDQDVIIVQNWQMGTIGIKYICNQEQNCQFAKFVNATANTPAPTPSPSKNPTKSPTPAPSMSPTAGPTHIGTQYPTPDPVWINVRSPTTVSINEVGGDGDGYWWEQCDGITAGSNSGNGIISYFPQSICIQASFFNNVFYDNYDNENEWYGWYCDTNNPQKYFMGVFSDSECTNLKNYGKIIEYQNDKCMPKIARNNEYKAYWTYIECSVRDDTNVFTPSPNEPQNPAISPIMSPATSPGMIPTVDNPQGNDANSIIDSFICIFGIVFVVQFIM